MKWIKKRKREYNAGRDALIILGIPTIGFYAYQVHVQPMDMIEPEIPIAEYADFHIAGLADREHVEKYQSLKEFSQT